MWKLGLVPLALVAGLAACDRNGERDDAMDTDTLGVVETPEQTQELLAPVRAVSMVTVDYGNMGMQRATREDIRRFGQTVGTDHRALIALLDSAGRVHGATLQETAVARELASTVRLAHAGLENLQEADFDLAFIRAQVESHRQLLDRIDHELIPAATSNPMQRLLQDTRAMVYAHLMRARQLLGDLLGEPVEPPPAGTAPEMVPRPPPPPPDTAPRPLPPDTAPHPPAQPPVGTGGE
jgi:predicted outer membrane protein